MTDISPAVTRVFDEAKALLLKKHHDYGASNISAAPGGPLNGLRVRMWDKTARLNNLIDKGVEPENESLRDTLVDMLNYSAIGLLVIDGDWPGTEAVTARAVAKALAADFTKQSAFAAKPGAAALGEWVQDSDGDVWQRHSDGLYRTPFGAVAHDRAKLDALHGPLTDLHSAPF